jgi:hypothetical protein
MSVRISGIINYSFFMLFVVFLNACASGHRLDQALLSADGETQAQRITAAYREKVESLQVELAALNRQANLPEAKQAAETAIMYSYRLADEYQLVRPAVLHNVLIRVGLKDRGLCYHWTEDLLKQLQSLELKTYQLHWAVAHRGSELREHNSVVITASGQAFERGVVLDPWRNSGDLYWSPVRTDRYPWQELPPSQW